MDKKKHCYVTKGKNKKKASSNNSQLVSKSQPMRKKGQSWGRNLENNNSPIWLTLEVIPFA